MFRRRKLAREWQERFDEHEEQARAAARDAVAYVLGGFMTDPDEYLPKACIVTRKPSPDESGGLMFKLAWDDDLRDGYLMDSNAGLIVREVVELGRDGDAPQLALEWGGPSVEPIASLRNLPGVFQDAFASYWTGLEVPTSIVTWVWTAAYGADEPYWGVRRFPAGIGEGPPIGGLGWGVFPKEVVLDWYDQRGW